MYCVIFHDSRGLYNNVPVIILNPMSNELMAQLNTHANRIVREAYNFDDDGWWELDSLYSLDSIPRLDASSLYMLSKPYRLCIVFSPSRESARWKLEQIITGQRANRILTTSALEYTLDNGEKWIWVNPESDSARGYRAHKAFIDKACSQEAQKNIVSVACANAISVELYEFSK